jgi:hypothetical protein
MWAKKRTTFLGFILLLVFLLQGMVPFLHAHTGMSSHSGLHSPSSLSSHHQISEIASSELASISPEESFAVQVETGLSKEHQLLVLGETFIRNAVWALTKPTSTIVLTSFLTVLNREPQTFYSSEALPPPSIAPPAPQL